jgi:hypothetical protein
MAPARPALGTRAFHWYASRLSDAYIASGRWDWPTITTREPPGRPHDGAGGLPSNLAAGFVTRGAGTQPPVRHDLTHEFRPSDRERGRQAHRTRLVAREHPRRSDQRRDRTRARGRADAAPRGARPAPRLDLGGFGETVATAIPASALKPLALPDSCLSVLQNRTGIEDRRDAVMRSLDFVGDRLGWTNPDPNYGFD